MKFWCSWRIHDTELNANMANPNRTLNQNILTGANLQTSQKTQSASFFNGLVENQYKYLVVGLFATIFRLFQRYMDFNPPLHNLRSISGNSEQKSPSKYLHSKKNTKLYSKMSIDQLDSRAVISLWFIRRKSLLKFSNILEPFIWQFYRKALMGIQSFAYVFVCRSLFKGIFR
jgi:hypothetical protein